MCASKHIKPSTARVSKKIESAIQSAIKCYEKKHDLKWCDGSYDPDEIKEAAEMLLSAKDAEVCICVGYPLGYRTPEPFSTIITLKSIAGLLGFTYAEMRSHSQLS